MKRKISNKSAIINIILTVTFVGFAFWILAVKNGFMLRWYDEMSFFDSSAYSFRQYLLYPGGIFRFFGTFLTQLLFYPMLGAAALIILWLICVWLTRISFGLSEAKYPLCFLVPFCLLASVLHFDEAMITFESQGYVFYNTIGFLFSIAAFYIFHTCRSNVYARASVAVILPLLYPVAGFFALLPALMAFVNLCMAAKNGSKIVNLASAGGSLLLMVMVPLLYYRYLNGTTVDNDYLYLKGLPDLTMNDYDWYLWRPFAFASSLLALFSILSPFFSSARGAKSKFMGWGAVILFAVGILSCVKADLRKSEQFRATVLMLNAIENQDWNRVNHILSLTKESANYTMCVLENLANAYTGRPRRNLDNMLPDNKDPRHAEELNISAYVEVPVNHNMGRFNQSFRWATEYNVQYGFRVYFLKYVVRNALMNGELELASKFNRMLMRTMFHRRWAENMQRIIDDPSLISTLPDIEFLMILRSEEVARGE